VEIEHIGLRSWTSATLFLPTGFLLEQTWVLSRVLASTSDVPPTKRAACAAHEALTDLVVWALWLCCWMLSGQLWAGERARPCWEARCSQAPVADLLVQLYFRSAQLLAFGLSTSQRPTDQVLLLATVGIPGWSWCCPTPRLCAQEDKSQARATGGRPTFCLLAKC
jgi:hypothetical protein